LKGAAVTEKLRGLDPSTLEVQLPGMVAHPLGLAPLLNVADLFALRELEAAPKGVARLVKGYRERVTRELSDLPNGAPFLSFVEKITTSDPGRFPSSFRAMVQQEAEREGRGTAEQAAVAGLVEHWSGTEPQAFEIKEPPARSKVERYSSKASGKTTKRTRSPAARRVGIPAIDEDQLEFVSSVILERLAGKSESGLAERVLMAGVRHRARELYPNLSPHVVNTVLKELLKSGKVSVSAKRWKYVG